MSTLKKINSVAFFLLPFVLVVHDKLIPPFILLLVVSCIPYFSKPSWKRIPIQFYALIALFLLYVIGLLYTDNIHYGLKDVESKLSFILFPLLFIFTQNKLPNKSITATKYGLIAGVGCSMLLSLIIALQCLFTNQETCFFAGYYGFRMHATYLSVLIIIASVIVFKEGRKLNLPFLFQFLFFGLALFECYLLRSLSSFLVIICFVVYVSFLLINTYANKHLKYVVPAVAILLLGVFFLVPKFKMEIVQSYNKVTNYISNQQKFLEENKGTVESNTVRLVAYSLSIEILNNNPFGKGTGDGKDELLKAYEAYGYHKYAEEKYNSHSTFLQTGISVGYVGILLLLIVLLYPFFLKKYRKNMLYILFLFSITVSCLFESYLERQVGIIFLSFGMFIFLKDTTQKLELETK